MRARTLMTALAGSVATLAVGGCADAPSAPDISRPAPRSPSLERGGWRPGDEDAGYTADPGTWRETFNVMATPETWASTATPPLNSWNSSWVKPVTFWQPLGVTPDLWYASNFVHDRLPDQARNSLSEWAVVKHDKDDPYRMRPMRAWHDMATCAAPPATHAVASFDESTFLCRDHMMTALNAATYGVTYLTPPRLVDLRAGQATVMFDVATKRTNGDDWVDLWVTRYDANLVEPLDASLGDVDLQGHPARGLHIRLTDGDAGDSRFVAYAIVDHEAIPIASSPVGYETKFKQSATVRRHFELRLTPTGIKFGIPKLSATGDVTDLIDGAQPGDALWWIDAQFPNGLTASDLGLDGAVVQIGHHSRNQARYDGQLTADAVPVPKAGMTWHWDNIGVNPSYPLTIVNAARRYVDRTTPAFVALNRSAPPNGYLRFAALGDDIRVKFDGGKWLDATRQAEQFDEPNRFHSYWMPIPEGTQRVFFQAPGPGRWMVRDITVFAR